MTYSRESAPDLVFGPVPSRRLGRSLGLNNIPPKICSYSCVYCQVGRTSRLRIEREPFYSVEEFAETVQFGIARLKQQGEPVDYLTFVPDGEPTLDANLGYHIENLRPFEIPVAVISNASLLWQEEVRRDLQHTNWCSVKVDTVDEACWQKINRPHGALNLPSVLQGMQDFSQEYQGELITETMLVKGINDAESQLKTTARFLADLRPAVAYLSVPTRPPAESWVEPPDIEAMNAAFHVFRELLDQVEFLIGYEGDQFASTENVEQDLLSITAVHPMRRSAVERLLRKNNGDWTIIEGLLHQEKLVEVDYGGEQFYLRNLKR